MSISVAIVDTGSKPDCDHLLAEVGAREQYAYHALCSRGRARQYLASRWLLRRHLAAELGRAPATLTIEYPDGAPPRLLDTPVRLGLSHGDALCMSVVSTDTAVGCDVERIRPRRHSPERIAELYFDRREAIALATRDAGRQQVDFHRLWTLKEAVLKSLGTGLSQGLDSAVFQLRPVLRCLRMPAAGGWLCAAAEWESPSGRFALAFATRQHDVPFTVQCFHPQGVSTPTLAWARASIEDHAV